ncbi:hypothetical protein OC846_001757 [Tilletia horrida]|uniref:Serine aminopeptidase S33 domain-containing protein n=1 Tax=Tilletia horrida TaxID=155126 RepID=A0AAN6GSN9_9BASI|nr:hypothetical protein OC845_002842 [Tilletia horrida]KAK0555329.1 hypothetical protein OC846_001757 [Tilletia horrida]KAK0568520.1 hypothetical protein OC861_001850 [Tilletia horrida]
MVLKGTHRTSDGASIAYELHGEHLVGAKGAPPPLVLIMGLSGVMPMWLPFAADMGKTRPVLIFDHRGIGLSTIPDEFDIFDLTYDTMVDDLLSLIASFDWAKSGIHILGYSMGGHILMHLLTRQDGTFHTQSGPSKGYSIKGVHITKAVLAATMTKMPKGDLKPADMQAIMAKYDDRATRDRAVTEYMIDLQYYPEWIAASSANKKIRDDRIDLSLTFKPAQTTVMAQMQAIGTVDVRKSLPKIPAQALPVLILHGKQDRMVKFEETQHTQRGITHADTLFVDGVAHFWYDMQGGSAFWVEQLGQWLDGRSSGSSHIQTSAQNRSRL